METYIALLRGINVSGQKSIKMDVLKERCKSLGFQNVQTYIQSGNIVFQTENLGAENLAQLMSEEIKTHFGFDVPTIVLTVNELKEIVENNPYTADKDNSFLHITFLSSLVESIDLESIRQKQLEGEEFILNKKTIYLYCPHGYGKTKLTNTFFENKLKVSTTTRNWKTVNTLLEMADRK